MKVLAINGSPRKEGNTYHALSLVADQLKGQGIEVEILHVGNQLVRGCTGCNMCMKNRDEKCVIQGDDLNLWVQKMKEADGILLGAPTYYAGIPGTMKSFLDRAFYVATANGNFLRHKVGAALTAVRRTGGINTFDQLNTYLNYSEMHMPTGNYWNVIHGTKPGDILADAEGVQTMEVLGQNMAYLLKMTAGNTGVQPPEMARKIYTNFIR